MNPEARSERGVGRPIYAIRSAPVKRKGRTQRDVLLEVLRIAAQYEAWVSLEELAAKTKFPPASISAQLRHLRKPEHGAWKIERRQRKWVRHELVWEYRLGV